MKNSAKQRKRVLAVIVLATVTVILCACGGGVSSSQSPTTSGNITVFVTDAAADAVLAFRADVTAASLKDSAGRSVSVTGLPRHLELRHLELAPTVLFQANVPPADYTSVNLTLANIEIVLASAGGAVQTFNASTSPGVIIGNPNVSVPINTTLAENSTPGLMADFDLRNSLGKDATGNYTFNPVVQGAAVSNTDPGWQLAGVPGKVVSLSNSSINLQLFDGGFTIPLQVDSNTQFSSDLQSIAGLSVGQAVETYAHFNNGTYTADSIDSAADPAVSKRGIVVGVPTVDGTPVNIVVQN